MRALPFVVAIGLTIGIIFALNHPGTNQHGTVLKNTATTAVPSLASRQRGAIAGYPDRGQLLAADPARKEIRSGASVWHPVQVSEAHALRAIAEGTMTLQAPNGQIMRLRYERHVEHPDGNWTWIGREQGSANAAQAVLTFGENAVFGTIRQGNADLSLTTARGTTWLVEPDPSLADGRQLAALADDVVVPQGTQPAGKLGVGIMRAANIPLAADAATAAPTIDVAMGFTSGFAERLGGQSQARTRLTYLVDLTNQTYVDSGISAQLRLVHSQQVGYPDATDNRSALFDLTSASCTEQASGNQYMSSSRWSCTPITPPVSLQPLLTARERYGADLVVLIRKFNASAQTSCGTAWLLGGGQNPIDAAASAFAMAVVNDSSADMFPDGGITCPEIMLAHELGHNMGQQHDRVTAMGSDDSNGDGNLLDPEEYGRHPYSFGYSTDGTAADIATIMSNRRPSQTRYRVFANPLISVCGGAPCGVANEADNARSMAETLPLVAAFRQEIGSMPHLFKDINGDGRADIFWSNRPRQLADWWFMNGAVRTYGGPKSVGSQYRVAGRGDFDGDGRSDVLWEDGATIWLWRSLSTGGFSVQFVANHPRNGWTIAGVDDFNGDGRADIFWSNRTLQRADLWTMNGAVATFSGAKTVPAQYHVSGVGDFDGDGRSDVLWEDGATIWLWRSEPAGGFSVHFVANHPRNGWAIVGVDDLNGDGRADIFWSNRTLQRADWWHMNGATPAFAGSKSVPSQYWVAGVGDFDGDGRSDVVWEDGVTIWLWRNQASGFSASLIGSHPGNGWAIAP